MDDNLSEQRNYSSEGVRGNSAGRRAGTQILRNSLSVQDLPLIVRSKKPLRESDFYDKVATLPYASMVDFQNRVHGYPDEPQSNAKGTFSIHDERPRQELLDCALHAKKGYEAAGGRDPAFLRQFKEMESYILYNRSPKV